jgi:Holin of 3TMs, for gene-transfer release
MALDPLTAGLDLAKTVVDKIWPDRSEEERAKLAAALQLVQGQLDINRTEAASPSVFVAGWRPAIGWVCGGAFAWNWIGLPVANFAAAWLGHSISLSPADMSEMMPVLMGMLGLGALRSFEKVKGVAS